MQTMIETFMSFNVSDVNEGVKTFQFVSLILLCGVL